MVTTTRGQQPATGFVGNTISDATRVGAGEGRRVWMSGRASSATPVAGARCHRGCLIIRERRSEFALELDAVHDIAADEKVAAQPKKEGF